MQYMLPNGQAIFIREAVVDDAAALLNMFCQAAKETSFLMTTPEEAQNLTLKQETVFIESYQNNEDQLFLIAQTAHEIAGSLSLTKNKWKKQQHIREFGIVVLRPYWNMGIARRMIHYMLQWAEQQRNIGYIYLHVMANNEKAVRLYHHFGFKEEGRMFKAVCLGEDNYQDVILMGKWIK